MDTIKVSNVRKSQTVDTAGAVDADVTIGTVEGEVTLVPHEVTGELATWGEGYAHWASQPLEQYLRGLGRDEAFETTGEIEQQTRRLARR